MLCTVHYLQIAHPACKTVCTSRHLLIYQLLRLRQADQVPECSRAVCFCCILYRVCVKVLCQLLGFAVFKTEFAEWGICVRSVNCPCAQCKYVEVKQYIPVKINQINQSIQAAEQASLVEHEILMLGMCCWSCSPVSIDGECFQLGRKSTLPQTLLLQ